MKVFPRQRPKRRCLVFTPLAYLKFQFLCHAGPTEVGAFAVSSLHRPLYIEELHTLPQTTSPGTVEFHDNAVADYFDQCVDRGLQPAQFFRLWLHTHPGDSAEPSGTDEETFQRVFGSADWAVMAILSREGRSYARMRLNVGPGASCRLRWRVDWSSWPEELHVHSLQDLYDTWQEEYLLNIHPNAPHRASHHAAMNWNSQLLAELDNWHSLSTPGDAHDVFS
jgi:proteasome lid subunit RPN8/RPN11